MDQYQSRFYVLESLLNDILSLIKPLESDHYQRQYAISQINNVAHSVASLKDVVIRPFGSFVSNLYTKWGDLDTSLELSHVAPTSTVKKQKKNMLRDLMRALRRHGVASSFTFVPQARVPVLKFQTNLHNISCDVSVDNHMGWMKSRILMQISEIDERFRDVVLLTKEWAKAQDINDPKTGTLNSYSLCLMVVFHFQTCSPAILPPLKDIYDGNFVDAIGPWSSIEMRTESACAANIAKFKIRKQRNSSSLCELLISFFDKFSILGSIASDTIISTCTGQWQNMRNDPRWMDKSHNLLVEDPFERPENAARAVSFKGLGRISEAFMTTFHNLTTKTVLSDRNLMLDVLLRRHINSQLKVARSPKLYSASKSQERPYPNGHHNRYQNNQISNIPHNIHASSGVSTSNHYTATRSPNPLHVGYIDVMPNHSTSYQNRNNARLGAGAMHYAVSAYVDDDDKQSRSYNNSSGHFQPSTSRTSQPYGKNPYNSYAGSQEQPVWKPKTLRR